MANLRPAFVSACALLLLLGCLAQAGSYQYPSDDDMYESLYSDYEGPPSDCNYYPFRLRESFWRWLQVPPTPHIAVTNLHLRTTTMSPLLITRSELQIYRVNKSNPKSPWSYATMGMTSRCLHTYLVEIYICFMSNFVIFFLKRGNSVVLLRGSVSKHGIYHKQTMNLAF